MACLACFPIPSGSAGAGGCGTAAGGAGAAGCGAAAGGTSAGGCGTAAGGAGAAAARRAASVSISLYRTLSVTTNSRSVLTLPFTRVCCGHEGLQPARLTMVLTRSTKSCPRPRNDLSGADSQSRTMRAARNLPSNAWGSTPTFLARSSTRLQTSFQSKAGSQLAQTVSTRW